MIQNLRVFEVTTDGDELRVDVYGGDESICGTLVYTFDDTRQRRQRMAILDRWRIEGTPLTYIRREESAALMDELAVFEEAFGSRVG